MAWTLLDSWWAIALWTILVFTTGFRLGRLVASQPPVEALDPARLSDTAHARIHSAMQNGNKIEAIRIVREETAIGLRDAKAFVDGLDRKNEGDRL